MNQSQCLKAMTGSGIDDFTQDDKTIERSRTTPNLRMHDEASMRQILRQYFMDTYDTYESIFECLACEEAFYIKPIALRHPLIFYYGHTATFFINKLLLTKMIDHRVNEKIESIFAVGVDEMGWDDLNETNYAWPSVAEVKAYRDQVRTLVLDLIDHAPLIMPIDWHNPWWAIIMGIEHEHIHLETSSVLIRQHALKYVQSSPHWLPHLSSGTAPTNQLIEVAQGVVSTHKTKQDALYGWDNEYGHHEKNIGAFSASQYLVSNQEFLAFVQQHGYKKPEYWESEGQAWLAFTQAEHPVFWINQSGTWFLRLMTEEVPLPWDWPVEVNYHEAKAFCNWKSAQTGKTIRLPTEDEWNRLYALSGLAEVDDVKDAANIKLSYGASSSPVNQFQHGAFYDVQGNVWQWTETAIFPYEKFEVHPIYDDFTAPTFDEKHNIMKGGSWISSGNEALFSSRYAFRRHFFQHAGFRYVMSDNQVESNPSVYETDQSVAQYLDFHYGKPHFDVENFPAALVQIAVNAMAGKPTAKALDIGCATGRASFELARHFDAVTGIDYSTRFIRHSIELQNGHSVRYTLPDEGSLVLYEDCNLKDFDFFEFKDRVQFFQGDACNLKQNFKDFDFILAANLIDRLSDPQAFLLSLKNLLKVGGVVLIASPYVWLEEFTPREKWLGGFKKDGESFKTLDGLKNILADDFKLLNDPLDVPFVIRETSRRFQHTLSQVTLWQRTD